MDLRQAAQSIIDISARNLAWALALCGADHQLRQEVEALWSLDLTTPLHQNPTSMDDDPLTPGATLGGRFRIIRELGHGGTGTVYQADDETGRPVALKVAYPGAEVAAGTCPLRAEYAAASRVQQPNIRRVDELFTLEPRNRRAVQVLVMEYIEGETLAARLARGPLASADLTRIAHALAAGLDAIHAAGLVHGDLKPGNILLRADLTPVIVDLGNCGTAASPDYMSPEQFRGLPTAPADDIFALGAILYEMATGTRPWPKEEILPAAIRRATEDVPGLTGDLPTGYADAVKAALNRNPNHRPRTATEAVREIGQPRAARPCRHRSRP